MVFGRGDDGGRRAHAAIIKLKWDETEHAETTTTVKVVDRSIEDGASTFRLARYLSKQQK